MTRCLNADNFRQALADVFRMADQVRAVLEQSRPSAADGTPPEVLRARREVWLECHARDYVIDQLLSALNWQRQPWERADEYVDANLVVEQSPAGNPKRYKAETEEHRRRMDYLGFARETERPLLVVEAKRPKILLPGVPSPLSFPEKHPVGEIVALALAKMRDATPLPEGLTPDWEKALKQIRDYCRTIFATRQEWPARAVLTNGDWLILFSNPSNAFVETGTAAISAHQILVFESRAMLAERHELLWTQLEYASLAKEDRRLHPVQVPFVVDPQVLRAYSYGLRISYTSKRTNYRKAPLLSVSPLLLVRSTGNTFLQVASDWDEEIPADGRTSLADHLQRIEAEATRLRLEFERTVLGGRSLRVVSVHEHGENTAAFRVRPFVQHFPTPEGSTFLVLTGAATHFVTADNGYEGCEFHRHSSAMVSGVAQRSAALLQSVLTPRSYFVDGSSQHCAHKAVYAVKQEQVTEENRPRCGPRSCTTSGAFCEVLGFEELLCCRVCTFHPVCAKASVYSLPCGPSVSLTCDGVPVGHSPRTSEVRVPH